RGGACLAHGGELGAVARDGRVGRNEMREQRAGDLGAAAMLAQTKERPGALAETLDEPRLGQQLEMARNARLRLAQDVGEVGYGEFGFRQQGDEPQPRVLAGRLERRVEGIETELVGAGHPIQPAPFWAGSHYIKICLYV